MSDDAMFVLAPVAEPGFDGCLLDAFCEDEGLAFAKLDEIEWRSIKRGAVALITACCSLADPGALVAPAY